MLERSVVVGIQWLGPPGMVRGKEWVTCSLELCRSWHSHDLERPQYNWLSYQILTIVSDQGDGAEFLRPFFLTTGYVLSHLVHSKILMSRPFN